MSILLWHSEINLSWHTINVSLKTKENDHALILVQKGLKRKYKWFWKNLFLDIYRAFGIIINVLVTILITLGLTGHSCPLHTSVYPCGFRNWEFGRISLWSSKNCGMASDPSAQRHFPSCWFCLEGEGQVLLLLWSKTLQVLGHPSSRFVTFT